MTQTRHRTESKQFQESQSQQQDMLESQNAPGTAAASESPKAADWLAELESRKASDTVAAPGSRKKAPGTAAASKSQKAADQLAELESRKAADTAAASKSQKAADRLAELESRKAADTAAALERMWGAQEEEQPDSDNSRIYEWSGKASELGARMIDGLDDRLDRISPVALQVWERGRKGIYHGMSKGSRACRSCLDQAVRHKKLLLRCLIGGGVAAAAIMLGVGHMSAYEYMYNGKVLGMVKDPNDVYQTIDVIGDKLCTAYHTKIKIDKERDITFRRVMGADEKLDSSDDILNNLTYLKDMKVTGYGIFVDGSQIAVVDSKEGATQILKEVAEPYIQPNANKQYEEVGFDQTVEIRPVDTRLGRLEQRDDVVNLMKTGDQEKKIHTVTQGETFSQIAKESGLRLSDLTAANPDVDPDKLQIGQELTLTKVSPIVDVHTAEVTSYNMPIYYGINYENSGAIYKGEQSVKQQGKNGKRQVTAKILKTNGVEQSRTELSSQVTQKPVDQVILLGAKDKPLYMATGHLMYPVRGRLSSRYGSRWGRMHSGIDLAVPKGTNVCASDSGTVVFAGWNGELGNCVKIDHGNGTQTWYGHASKLLVKTGQKVLKGQAIAKAGSTGNSTGSHVHFEVHVNGKAVNPLNYL